MLDFSLLDQVATLEFNVAFSVAICLDIMYCLITLRMSINKK